MNERYRVLSLQQVADLLGIHVATLERLHARGEGPPRIKISARRWGYPAEAFMEWQRKKLEAENGC